MKAVALLLITAAFCAGPVQAANAKDPPITASTFDANAYFRLGELFEANRWTSYFHAISNKLDERFDAFAAELKRLGAPAEVLKDLAAYRKGLAGLPVSKWYADWTEAEQKRWRALGFNYDIWNNWLSQLDNKPMFFWYAGRAAFRGWYVIGRDVVEQGYAIKDYEQTIRQAADDIRTDITDSGYEKARKLVTPEALTAMKAIAELASAMDDPFGEGVTMDQAQNIATNGRLLSDLARKNNLTTATTAK